MRSCGSSCRPSSGAAGGWSGCCVGVPFRQWDPPAHAAMCAGMAMAPALVPLATGLPFPAAAASRRPAATRGCRSSASRSQPAPRAGCSHPFLPPAPAQQHAAVGAVPLAGAGPGCDGGQDARGCVQVAPGGEARAQRCARALLLLCCRACLLLLLLLCCCVLRVLVLAARAGACCVLHLLRAVPAAPAAACCCTCCCVLRLLAPTACLRPAACCCAQREQSPTGPSEVQ